MTGRSPRRQLCRNPLWGNRVPRSLKSGSIGPWEKSSLMNRAFQAADRIIRAAREHARPALAIASVVLACAAAGGPRAHAAPLLWAHDDDRIDHRTQTAHPLGD